MLAIIFLSEQSSQHHQDLKKQFQLPSACRTKKYELLRHIFVRCVYFASFFELQCVCLFLPYNDINVQKHNQMALTMLAANREKL